MDTLGLRRYCCRRMILSHTDVIEKLLNGALSLPLSRGLADSRLDSFLVARECAVSRSYVSYE